MPSAEARSHQHRHRLTARGSDVVSRRVRQSWRAARALFAPWSNGRPFTEYARLAVKTLRGYVPDAGRAPPHAVGRGSAASPPRQVGGTAFKFVVAILFESRGAQPVSFPTRRVLANRPWGTRHTPLCGLGMVLLWANKRRTPPHAVGRGSTAPKPRQVGGTSFGSFWPPRTNLVTSGPRAVRPEEYRSTTHETCAPRSADLAWLCCGPTRGALLPRRRPGLDRTNTATGPRQGLQKAV